MYSCDESLPHCPVCGSKAFIHHDIVTGYDFGWSVGCPRACIADGIHGFDDPESFKNAKLVFHGLSSRKSAEDIWKSRCMEDK